ncbi:MAG: amino acid permease [Calditrichaeota bacterium]|nr:MAG: amino acid permease [Calditrichota bacterium]MBL1204335.1 amino acid permease [Calditrichota bacterium]NOG44164.1 amino acid permease [Calditrichota bacterium]
MTSPVEPTSQVKKKISLTTAIAIVVANMIGTGIFTTTGIMANYLPNSSWIVTCWLLGGLIALSGALSYSELSTRMPEEGGEYVYLKKLYHPVVGFLTGWTSFFVGFSAPIAGAAISFAAYFLAGSNLVLFEGFLTSGQSLKVIGILVVILFTAIHYFGVKFGSIIQNSLTVLKILIILGLSITGILFGGGNIELFSDSMSFSVAEGGFGVAMMLVMFSYSGWNASTYIAGELVNPKKTLPRSLISGTLIVIGLYLLLNIFILKEVPFQDIRDSIAIVEQVSTHAFGSWVGDIFGLLISIALLSSLSAFIIIGPRVYYAMAIDKMFFSFASRISPKYEVPGYSILVQGLLAVFMVLVGTFEQLLIYIGFALNIFPWLAVFGLFLARKRKIGEEFAVKTWGYPVIPIFFLISSFLIMVAAFINRPVESITAIVTVLVGIPIYYLMMVNVKKKRDGV